MTTTDLPLIRLSAANPFLLELSRPDAASLLASHSLPTDVPTSADLFVSSQLMYRLVEQTAEIAANRFLGFQVGRQVAPAEWAPIADAVDASTTLGGLLGRYVVNASEHSTATAYFLNTQQSRTTFGMKRAAKPDLLPAQNDAFSIGLLSALLISATGGNWSSREVLFTVADPTTVPTSDERLRVVPGDAMGPKVSFPTNWLFSAHQLGGIRDDALLHHNNAPDSIVDAVKVAIRPYLHERNLDVGRAAVICGIERRRLSRALSKHGTSMYRIISDLRCEQAARDLVESDKRIREVGESIGFQDATVFSRAFKNWTGLSPLHYRQSRRN